MANLKLRNVVSRGEHNELISTTYAAVDGKWVRVTPAGAVWGPKLWKGDSAPRYSRLAPVIEVKGRLYRCGSTSASPLKLAKGENHELNRFAPGKAFIAKVSGGGAFPPSA